MISDREVWQCALLMVKRYGDAEAASALLQKYPASRMSMYPGSKRVGNVKHDDPESAEPVA